MNKINNKASKLGVSIENVKEELMKDTDFKEEYNKLTPRYEIISQLIAARKSQHITQDELAKRAGTKKSNISRLESGSYNPTLDFLFKIANSLETELKIDLIKPQKTKENLKVYFKEKVK